MSSAIRPPRHLPAFARRIAGLRARASASPIRMPRRRRLRDIVKSHPLEVVAQEVVKLSTMPCGPARSLSHIPLRCVSCCGTPEG